MQLHFKSSSFLFVILLSASCSMAQQKFQRQEIYIGYGYGTVQETQAMFANIFGDNTETGKNGAIAFGYRYHINKKWAAGVTGIIDNVKVTEKNNSIYMCKTYAAMADVQHYYIRDPFIQLYSGIYAGYGHFATNKAANENYSTVAFHATALGLRAGKTIGIFGEAGFGYRGIFNIGISAKF